MLLPSHSTERKPPQWRKHLALNTHSRKLYLFTSNSFLKKLVRRQHSFLRRWRITFIGQNYVTHIQQFLLRQVEVLAARRWNLQSWRHKAIWLEPSIAELGTHNVWTATLARTSIACSRLQCKLYACKSLCIFISLNVIYLCLLGLALQKYALFDVF